MTVSFRRAAAVATLASFWASVSVSPVIEAQAVPSQAVRPESSVTIAHDELPCVTTEIPPEVDASVQPGPQYEKGYVYFKAAGTDDYYYAPMKGQPESLAGTLPRPLPETKAIDYFVKATDVQDLSKQTREFVPPVVPGNACKVKGTPPGSDGAGLTIGLTKDGQNPVPPGFNKKDIKFVILLSGAVVGLAVALKGASSGAGGAGAGAAGAGAAGGISTAVAVAAGVAVAGGIAAGVAVSKKSAATPVPTVTPSPTPTLTPTPLPTAPPLHFVLADATWSGEGDVDVRLLDSGGNSVGVVVPAGCSPTTQRTERVLFNGVVPNGTYRVVVTANSCGVATPPQIAVAVTAQVDATAKCTGVFLNVPVGGGPVQACTFTIP